MSPRSTSRRRLGRSYSAPSPRALPATRAFTERTQNHLYLQQSSPAGEPESRLASSPRPFLRRNLEFPNEATVRSYSVEHQRVQVPPQEVIGMPE
jgi:hypothetical protein